MYLASMTMSAFRCFEFTDKIEFDPKINVFIGQNNSGKTSLLRSILSLQGFSVTLEDRRKGSSRDTEIDFELSGTDVGFFEGIYPSKAIQDVKIRRKFIGGNSSHQNNNFEIPIGASVFASRRPLHTIVPFLSKRKVFKFEHTVNSGVASGINGTYSNLYSRVDTLVTAGHPDHNAFVAAVKDVIGLPVTTRASSEGKEAGFYPDRESFIDIMNMGDGVSDLLAFIAELCSERNKIFVIEEPETSIHPEALRKLMGLVRKAAAYNQFFIATHSNIVLRELCSQATGKIFHVSKESEQPESASVVEAINKDPQSLMDVLADLGYSFADLNMFEAWLFLEESSAEQIIRDLLVPWYAPSMFGKLRTYSAKGASKLSPRFEEFQSLVVFVHLQKIYEGRVFVRADGDDIGQKTIAKIRETFPLMDEHEVATFKEPHFENYYPAQFKEKIEAIFKLEDKQLRKVQKTELLLDVVQWSKQNAAEAKVQWTASAKEVIDLLRSIEVKLSKPNEKVRSI